jgi:hypothetical protein
MPVEFLGRMIVSPAGFRVSRSYLTHGVGAAFPYGAKYSADDTNVAVERQHCKTERLHDECLPEEIGRLPRWG